MITVSDEIKQRIIEKVEWCIARAHQEFNKDYNIPSIHYYQSGVCAGYAMGRSAVFFNATLLVENLEDFIATTVPHEVAHIIDTCNGYSYTYRGKRVIHGPSWKYIMSIFGADSSRTHKYDTSNAQKRVKMKFKYTCKVCNTSIFMGPVRHRNSQAGARYFHNTCGRGATLLYSAPMGRVTYRQAQKSEQTHTAAPPVSSNESNHPSQKSSNLERARILYHQHSCSRSEMIKRFITELNMKKTTASTYYSIIRSEKR